MPLGKLPVRGGLGYILRRFSLPLARWLMGLLQRADEDIGPYGNAESHSPAVGADALIRPPVQAAATAQAARSEAERAEREAGQMRSCTPTQDAPSATGQQSQESQKRIACPKARQNRSRHRYADPRAHGGPPHRSAPKRPFLLDRARPVSLLTRPKEKWGVHLPSHQHGCHSASNGTHSPFRREDFLQSV